jgi:hypothetical protein
MAKTPPSPELVEAFNLIKAGQHEQAGRLLKSYLAQHKEDVDGWWLMAHAASQPDTMRRCLEMVLKLDPKHAKARAKLDKLAETGASPIEAAAERARIAVKDFGGCVGSVLLGVFYGVLFNILFNIVFDVLFGVTFFAYMFNDRDHTGFCIAALAIFIVCFMLRYADDRLKQTSTIMMIAVATTTLLPWVLFALFIILLVLTGTEF